MDELSSSASLFYLLAGGMVMLALAVLLPTVWRGVRLQPAGAPARRSAWRTTALLVAGLPLLAFGTYGLRGDLGALRPERSVLSEQWLQQGLPADGEARAQLLAELDQYLQKQPRDPRALVLKARLEMRAERYDRAVVAFEGAVAGRSKAANDPDVWVEYAEALGMAQGGTLVGEPQRLVRKALDLDARHPQALDLAGSAAWETQDYALAAMYWTRLLAQMPPGDSRRAELQAAIERAERRARLALPVRP
jgi:cytochrome c-type biogenesis protein CcmH